MIDFIFQNPKQNPDLNGIFSILRKEKDPIPEDVVNLSSIGTLYTYEDVRNILSSDDSLYTSVYNDDAWIIFEFVNKSIFPTFYTLRTVADSQKYTHFPRCWNIDGSNNNITWKTIDSQETDVFDDYNKSCTFKIKNTGIYKYIRFQQTYLNSRNENLIRLSQVEFFGALIENEHFNIAQLLNYFGTKCSLHYSLRLYLYLIVLLYS